MACASAKKKNTNRIISGGEEKQSVEGEQKKYRPDFDGTSLFRDFSSLLTNLKTHTILSSARPFVYSLPSEPPSCPTIHPIPPSVFFPSPRRQQQSPVHRMANRKNTNRRAKPHNAAATPLFHLPNTAAAHPPPSPAPPPPGSKIETKSSSNDSVPATDKSDRAILEPTTGSPSRA